jgi:DNA mismatch repair protein MutH
MVGRKHDRASRGLGDAVAGGGARLRPVRHRENGTPMLWTPTADEAAVLDAAIANLDG